MNENMNYENFEMDIPETNVEIYDAEPVGERKAEKGGGLGKAIVITAVALGTAGTIIAVKKGKQLFGKEARMRRAAKKLTEAGYEVNPPEEDYEVENDVEENSNEKEKQ
jgi:hypothetical protein